MTRRLLMFTSIVMLTSLTGCTMDRTCNSQDMIAMKKSGFSPGQIESSCTRWGLDDGAVQTLSQGVATGMKEWAELEKAKREAAKIYGGLGACPTSPFVTRRRRRGQLLGRRQVVDEKKHAGKSLIEGSAPAILCDGEGRGNPEEEKIERPDAKRPADLKIPDINPSLRLIFHKQQSCEQECRKTQEQIHSHPAVFREDPPGNDFLYVLPVMDQNEQECQETQGIKFWIVVNFFVHHR